MSPPVLGRSRLRLTRFLLTWVAIFGVSCLEAAGQSCTADPGGGEGGYCPNPDAVAGASKFHPQWPLQFIAKVNTTAHRLDPSKGYPLAHKFFQIWYDQPMGRFRADLLHIQRTLIRRFDEGYETITTRLEGATECRQSKLQGGMVLPEWPSEAQLKGEAEVRGRRCQHWHENHGRGTIDLYTDANTGAPVEVRASTLETVGGARELVNAAASDKQVENNSGRARGSKSNLEALPTSYFLPPQADITYSVTEFLPGAPDKKAFAMPEDVKGGLDSCEQEPNNIGFPYLHFFHFYFRG